MADDFEKLKNAFKECFEESKYTFKEGNDSWVYAAPKDVSYDNSVHYELDKRGGCFFVDFHIENKYYHSLFEKINENLDNDNNMQRLYYMSTYYTCRYINTRSPVFTKDHVKEAVDQMRNFIDQFLHKSQQKSEEGDDLPVGIQTTPISEILSWQLNIPDYQRSFCWRKENILVFLNDMAKWLINHPQKDDYHIGPVYHIGTIVLKKRKKDQDTYCDIIDGQQRLITLGLLLNIKNASKIDFKLELGNNNSTEEAKWYLKNAYDTISSWTGCIDLSRIQMSVIFIGEKESEDLAFLFFNHLNSSGKRLSDYDLLKSHHLRFVNGTVSGVMAKRWNELDSSANPQIKRELLHNILYRLRNWIENKRKFPYNADELETRDLFNHFTLDFEPLKGLCTPYLPARIDSLLSGGLEFFNYVEHFRLLLERFSNLDCVTTIEPLRNHSYGTLYAGIYALSFMFYCKFGEIYLREAMYAIAYNVSRLRNEHAIQRRYLTSENVFFELASLINRTTHESEFLGKTLDANTRYKQNNSGRTQENYWNVLNSVLKRLSTENVNDHYLNLQKYEGYKEEAK